MQIQLDVCWFAVVGCRQVWRRRCLLITKRKTVDDDILLAQSLTLQRELMDVTMWPKAVLNFSADFLIDNK